MIDYKKILKDLSPFRDKVFLCPALDEEIEMLQSFFDKKIPDYFIEFLNVIGLKQDLTYEIFDRVSKYEQSFAIEAMPSDIYFPIGNNWHEGDLFIKFDTTDQNVYEYFHDGDQITNLGTFEELIYKNINHVKENYQKLTPNSEKTFQAYYSLGTSNDKFMISQLSKYIDAKLIAPLSLVEDDFDNKKKYEGLVQIGDYQLKTTKEGRYNIKLQWEAPVEEVIGNTFFLKLEAALDQCVFSYYPSTFWVARW